MYVSSVIHPDSINHFPSTDLDTFCTICKTHSKTEDRITLTCSHIFHGICIDEWSKHKRDRKEQAFCPNCIKPFKVNRAPIKPAKNECRDCCFWTVLVVFAAMSIFGGQ
jgi:hypothetical protein